ncbi:alpha/beta hydrolase family protein [Chloroflexota bacterium]
MKFEKLERRRDNQQWMLDYLVMATGRSILFDHEERRYPEQVRSYRMLPKQMARGAKHKEEIAIAAEAAGHNRTASELYLSAVLDYHEAQHVIFQDDNPQKLMYYEALSSCFERLIQLANYPIERVDVPWEGQVISCLLHLLPDRRKAPITLFIPGMDMIKEAYPRVVGNAFIQREMHCLSMDGPGQGVSNIRKVRVTDDNYEKAASAVIDYLTTRQEVDATKIGVCGVSMGSHWGTRLAAYDSRVAAVATASACYGSKLPIFEMASPRFKQIFMYMSGIHDEANFDEMAARMTCLGYGDRIRCPSLMIVGEYDQLCFLEDSLALYNELAGPKELWLLEDVSHSIYALEGFGGLDAMPLMADWLMDALNGKVAGRQIVRISKDWGKGPYGAGSSCLKEEELYL